MPQQQPTPSLPCCRGAGGEASPAVSPGCFASSRRQKGTHRGLSPGNPPTPHFTAGSRREKRRREALPPLYEEECLCARRRCGVSVAAPRPSPTHTHAFVGAAAPDRGGSSPAPPQIKESADSAAGVSAATAATPRLGAAGPGGGREGGRRRRGRKGRRRKEGSGDEGGGRGERGPTCSAGTRSVCVEEGAPSTPGGGGWRSRRSLPHADGTDPPPSRPAAGCSGRGRRRIGESRRSLATRRKTTAPLPPARTPGRRRPAPRPPEGPRRLPTADGGAGGLLLQLSAVTFVPRRPPARYSPDRRRGGAKGTGRSLLSALGSLSRPRPSLNAPATALLAAAPRGVRRSRSVLHGPGGSGGDCSTRSLSVPLPLPHRLTD